MIRLRVRVTFSEQFRRSPVHETVTGVTIIEVRWRVSLFHFLLDQMRFVSK